MDDLIPLLFTEKSVCYIAFLIGVDTVKIDYKKAQLIYELSRLGKKRSVS